MGSRATDKLKEIEDLRVSLERKLGEIERRLPIAGLGRRAVALLAGGSAGGTAVAFALRRVRGRRKKRGKAAAAAAPSVVVNVVPRGAAWIAAAGVAAWAGARLYEAIARAKATQTEESFRPAVIKPIPDSSREERQTGAGT